MIEFTICRTCKNTGRTLNSFGECADCSKAHSEEVRAARGKVSPNEEQLCILWEIACNIAKNDLTYETGLGDIECNFCNGHKDYSTGEFEHTAKCIVTKARALVDEIEKGNN